VQVGPSTNFPNVHCTRRIRKKKKREAANEFKKKKKNEGSHEPHTRFATFMIESSNYLAQQKKRGREES